MLMEKLGKLSLNYLCYPFLSGAPVLWAHQFVDLHLKLLMCKADNQLAFIGAWARQSKKVCVRKSLVQVIH